MTDQFYFSPEEYRQKYQESISDPAQFWGELAQQELHWFSPWNEVFSQNGIDYQWFVGGKLNITVNCLDRHIANGKGEKIAYIYIREDGEEIKITYQQLLEKVNKIANGLKKLGVKKGDIVTLYMPLTIEQIATMLAVVRIGAIHSVIYAGFSVDALVTRIKAAQSKIVVTSEYTLRRGKEIPLLETVRKALPMTPTVENVVVVNRSGEVDFQPNEVDLQTFMAESSVCEPSIQDAEDPLFILYTSGTTGTPKGVVHTTGGYNLYTHYTTKVSFNLTHDDIYWCTADCGWITGHSYIVYGPLSNHATTIIYEGSPDTPVLDRWWQIIEKYKVTKFYTAPTAVRMFMKWGEEYPQKHDLSSLKIIGSVGEPINPEAWHWYRKYIGNDTATVIDTWWQTETGGHMLVTLPSMPQKAGKAGLPFFGIEPDVLDKQGNPVEIGKQGFLVIKHPWPSALRTCWGNHDRFSQYWTEIKDYYTVGDVAIKDEDGYIQILGRSDDVISVSGHRIGSAEVESALIEHPAVAEAAVVGLPDEIKGEYIRAYVITLSNIVTSVELAEDIKNFVKEHYGAHATPSEIEFVDKLPKTRSGKIMRRVLKAQALGNELGDVSTLED